MCRSLLVLALRESFFRRLGRVSPAEYLPTARPASPITRLSKPWRASDRVDPRGFQALRGSAVRPERCDQ